MMEKKQPPAIISKTALFLKGGFHLNCPCKVKQGGGCDVTYLAVGDGFSAY
jgi:hypothetical protein